MKNLTILSTTLFILFSCSNSQEGGDSVVLDFPKPDDYYQKSECDEGHKHSGKELIVLGPAKRPSKASRKVSSVSDLLDMAGTKSCPDLTKQEIRDLDRTANLLRGSLDDPRDYRKSGEGFQAYIDDV